MGLSHARIGAWLAVAVVTTGCGRISFERQAVDAGAHALDAGAHALDAGSVDAAPTDAGAAMDAAAADAGSTHDAGVGTDAGLVDGDAGPPSSDAGPPPPDAGPCVPGGLPVSPGSVSRDSFDVLGGPEPLFVWVAPGSTTISISRVTVDGLLTPATPIAAVAPSAPRVARTPTGIAIAWVDGDAIRLVRASGGVATPPITVFSADVAYQPSIATIGNVVGLSWLAASRTPSDLWFATVNEAGAVSAPVRLSSSSPGAGPVAATGTVFAVLVPDTGGKQLARFDTRGALLGTTPVVSPTPFGGRALGWTGARYLAAGNFGFSTYVVALDSTGALFDGELAIPLPADAGDSADCWQGVPARGAWAVPRWSASSTPATSTIDVAWTNLDGTLSALPRTTIALGTASSQRVVVAPIGELSYFVAWASPFALDAPLQARIFCP